MHDSASHDSDVATDESLRSFLPMEDCLAKVWMRALGDCTLNGPDQGVRHVEVSGARDAYVEHPTDVIPRLASPRPSEAAPCAESTLATVVVILAWRHLTLQVRVDETRPLAHDLILSVEIVRL